MKLNGADFPDGPEVPAEIRLYVMQAVQETSREIFKEVNEHMMTIGARVATLETELIGRRAIKSFVRYALDIVVGLAGASIFYLLKHYFH